MGEGSELAGQSGGGVVVLTIIDQNSSETFELVMYLPLFEADLFGLLPVATVSVPIIFWSLAWRWKSPQ